MRDRVSSTSKWPQGPRAAGKGTDRNPASNPKMLNSFMEAVQITIKSDCSKSKNGDSQPRRHTSTDNDAQPA